MPRMVTGEELLRGVRDQTFIKNGKDSAVEGIKYDFHLGLNVLKASFRRPVNVNDLSETEKKDLLVVDPGEMVFVLTEERLELPADMKAELSHKRKLSHDGILVMGGFCVDPLYVGPLVLGLYNFSSTPYTLMPGKKVIAATFYKLDVSERGDAKVVPDPISGFPDDIVKLMKNYQPLAIQAVAETVRRLQADLDTLRSEIGEHDAWYKRFQFSLDAHNQQIGTLTSGLDKETEARKAGHDDLKTAVDAVKMTLTRLEGTGKAITAMLGIALALLLAWIAKILWGG